MTDIIYKELSYAIMEALYEVHKVLGPGFSENIYEEAVCSELLARNIMFERQKNIEIKYKGDTIGEYRLDVVVDEKVILELKAVGDLNEVFKSQLLSYLKATGYKLGILANFGVKSLQYKRIVL